MSKRQQGSWYWPPVFTNAEQLIGHYDSVEIPDEALFRFANAFTRRALAEGATGVDSRIPPHVTRSVIRAAMMRAIGASFHRRAAEDRRARTQYIQGDLRTVKWIALHFKTDDLGFDALYGTP